MPVRVCACAYVCLHVQVCTCIHACTCVLMCACPCTQRVTSRHRDSPVAGSQSFLQHHKYFEYKLNFNSRLELCDSMVQVTCLHGGVDSVCGRTHQLQTIRDGPVSMLSRTAPLLCVPLACGRTVVRQWLVTADCELLAQATSRPRIPGIVIWYLSEYICIKSGRFGGLVQKLWPASSSFQT